MPSDYDIEVFDRPGLNLPNEQKRSLQADICSLAASCLSPLPRYQVFDTTSSTALDDKVIVTARQGNTLVGFVSAVLIPIEGLENPILHTGITVIHPRHRRSSVKRLIFGNLCISVLSEFPEGVWLTSLAEVITSLVHIAKYTTKVFPSPQWENEQGSSKPSDIHLMIAKNISMKHRSKMLISPNARFDEEKFIFLGSNDWPEGRVFMKDVDDAKSWHRDDQATQFFRKFFRRWAGDEVLQVSFLDLSVILTNMEKERYAKNDDGIVSKL